MKITNRPLERNTIKGYLRDISRYPLLSVDEEAKLGYRAIKGDEAAREKIICSNLRFVIAVSKEFQTKNITIEDIIQAGNLGLIEASKRWDPYYGFKFCSYAVWYIRHEILLYLSGKNIIPYSANMIAYLQKIHTAQERYFKKYNIMPDMETLSEITGLQKEEINSTINNTVNTLPLDEENANEQDLTYLTCEQTENGSLISDINSCLEILTHREREILKETMGMNASRTQRQLEDIGEKFELTRERTRQLQNRALNKLKLHCIKEKLRQYL